MPHALEVNVKLSRYRPGVAQRVGRGIALLFHDRGIRRGWVVSSTSRPHFTPRKDPVPILKEAGWAPGPVWKVGKSCPHQDSIPDRPARSQSLYRLSYLTHLPWGRGRKIKQMLLRNKLPYENCTCPGYYAPSSGNLLPIFRDNLLVPSSAVENPKACCPNVEFIQGRVWVVKRLSSVVSANWVYASVWDGGEYGGQCSFGDKPFA